MVKTCHYGVLTGLTLFFDMEGFILVSRATETIPDKRLIRLQIEQSPAPTEVHLKKFICISGEILKFHENVAPLSISCLGLARVPPVGRVRQLSGVVPAGDRPVRVPAQQLAAPHPG